MKILIRSLLFCLMFAAGCDNLRKISGYVFDYDTGKPIQGAVVKYHNDCNKCRNEKEIIGITDNNGRYRIDVDSKGILNYDKSIEVKKDGYTTFSDKLNIKKDYELTIYLKESAFKNI